MRGLPLILSLVLAAACSPDAGSDATPAPSRSGAAGVTQDTVQEAILGLCAMASETDRDAANAAFHDRAHETLHALAAEAEEQDRAVAGALLVAKQRVEADLSGTTLPPSFDTDAQALLEATRAAIETVGLVATSCET